MLETSIGRGVPAPRRRCGVRLVGITMATRFQEAAARCSHPHEATSDLLGAGPGACAPRWRSPTLAAAAGRQVRGKRVDPEAIWRQGGEDQARSGSEGMPSREPRLRLVPVESSMEGRDAQRIPQLPAARERAGLGRSRGHGRRLHCHLQLAVNDIVMPLVGLMAGGIDFTQLSPTAGSAIVA